MDPESIESPSRPLMEEFRFKDEEKATDSDSNMTILHAPILPRPFYTRSFFHLIFYGIYTVVLIVLLLKLKPDDGRSSNIDLPFPARDALVTEVRYFETKLWGNSLAGKPRPELDESWSDLLKGTNILLPKASLDKFDLQSIMTKDGKSGIAQLSVFHALHCVKLVRQMLYKDYYHKDDSERVIKRLFGHADHCLEYIRESLMCHPDISPVTFVWLNETAQHPDHPERWGPLNTDKSPHQCVNWEKLADWAQARRFDLYNLEPLEDPGPM